MGNRNEQRFIVQEPEKLQITVNKKNSILLLNLSHSGAALHFSEKTDFDKDDLVLLHIKRLDNETEIQLPAKVIWVIVDTIGVQFVHIDEESNNKIDGIIKDLKGYYKESRR